nr:MAG TPA: hypothetical protein [Caudoviricetes sp.]
MRVEILLLQLLRFHQVQQLELNQQQHLSFCMLEHLYLAQHLSQVKGYFSHQDYLSSSDSVHLLSVHLLRIFLQFELRHSLVPYQQASQYQSHYHRLLRRYLSLLVQLEPKIKVIPLFLL